jgi:alpha-galactosidase
MHRRNFVKLSATAVATLLFSRITYANGNATLINNPDEVWGRADGEWFRLKSSGREFTYKDVEVSIKTNGNASGVYVQSPATALTGIRLKWKHQTDTTTKMLGDHWERTYGDLAWKSPAGNIKNPWYVLLNDDKHTACFGVKTGANTICWWAVNPDSIELTLDTHSGGSGVQLGARKLHAADIVTTESTVTENAFATASRFCKLMCDKPRLPKQPVYGINDWYYAYGNNSAKLIRETTALMAELVTDTDNRPFSVVDAGWAEYSPLLPGDGGWNETYAKPNDKFKDMHQLGNEIKKLGMRPGLWIRPLCARHDEKASLLLPKTQGRDNIKTPLLDPTIPENMERIKGYFDVYKQWGFEMVKHDYTTNDISGRWGFEMKDSFTAPGWSFYDKSKTTAEVINHLYTSIREAAGEHIYVIGCNTMSHLSAGQFELNRIGDDTSGKEWARTRKMGVNTMGFRLPQHNAFYAVDGDCVGLTTDISWEKNKQWMQLLAESSAPLFISAQPEALGAEQKRFIKECFAKAAKPQPIGEPLDWMTNPFPSKWKLNNREVDFNWS